MWGSQWQLASRILEDPDYLVVKRSQPTGGRYQIWYHPDPDQLPEFVGNFLITTDYPHFPYGWEVEPD